MGFMDVLIGAGVGFLTGGPAGAVAGGILGSGALDTDTGAVSTDPRALALSNTSLTKATTQAVATTAGAEQTFLEKVGAAIAGGGAAGVAGALAPAATTAVLTGGVAGCPPGKNRVRTVIQTINPAGKIIKQKIEQGRPFLMARDIVIAKRVFRTVAKVSGRLPRKTVKQSKASMLTDAALDKALRDTMSDDNGNGGKC